MLEAILICIAVCADAFAAGYAYGIKGMRIGLIPAFMIGLTGAVFLGASLWAAGAVSGLLSHRLCSTLSAAILILIAMKSLADAQPSPNCDVPGSGDITLGSSLVLAAALSVDSLGVGFGAGVTMRPVCKLFAAALCLLLGMSSVLLGRFLGVRHSKGAGSRSTALVSSGLLFFIAVMKLI